MLLDLLIEQQATDVLRNFLAKHQPTKYQPIVQLPYLWQPSSDVTVTVAIDVASNPIFRVTRQPWRW